MSKPKNLKNLKVKMDGRSVLRNANAPASRKLEAATLGRKGRQRVTEGEVAPRELVDEIFDELKLYVSNWATSHCAQPNGLPVWRNGR